MKNEIKLEKMHVAMLSGGKDSLYMFAHIMANIDKYPLDAVAHIKMPYDYPNLYNWYMELAEETDDYISNKKGKPFSVWGLLNIIHNIVANV